MLTTMLIMFATGVFGSSARLYRIERILEVIEENMESNRVARQADTRYDHCVAAAEEQWDATCATHGKCAATLSNWKQGCEFRRDGTAKSDCQTACASQHGIAADCCQCNGTCASRFGANVCRCSSCKKYCGMELPSAPAPADSPAPVPADNPGKCKLCAPADGGQEGALVPGGPCTFDIDTTGMPDAFMDCLEIWPGAFGFTNIQAAYQGATCQRRADWIMGMIWHKCAAPWNRQGWKGKQISRGEYCTTNPCQTPVLTLDWIPPYPSLQVSSWENSGTKFTMKLIKQSDPTWMGPPCIGFIDYTPPDGVEKCSWLAGKTDQEWEAGARSSGRYFHYGNTPVKFNAKWKDIQCADSAERWRGQFQYNCLRELGRSAGLSWNVAGQDFEITDCDPIDKCNKVVCTTKTDEMCERCETGYEWDEVTRTCAAPPDCALLECGRKGMCREEPYCADLTELHEVGCCADFDVFTNAVSPGHRGNDCTVFGSRREPTCIHAMTHAEATQHCADVGGRLCTREELESDCTSWSGCMHDFDLLWSSDVGYLDDF